MGKVTTVPEFVRAHQDAKKSETPRTVLEVVSEATKPFRDAVAARQQAKRDAEVAAIVAAEQAKKEAEAAAQAKTDPPAGGPPADGGEHAQKGYAFKANGVDEELGVIHGVASAADIFDREDEAVQKGTLVRMAFDYTAKKSRQVKLNHDKVIDCDLVESFVGAPIVEVNKATAQPEIVGVDRTKPATHWFVTVRPHDKALVEAAKSGEIVGFSWAGKVERTPVTE